MTTLTRGLRRDAWRTTLLSCGIASSVLYAAMMWAIRCDGYSAVSQTVSELSAIGAPTRPLWIWMASLYTALVAAFGAGLWIAAGGNRALRITGSLILAYAALGVVWPFAAMHQRDVLAAGGGTFSDTMHLVLGGITVILMFLAIGFSAAAFGRRFRIYAIASIVILVAFGVLTFLEAPRLAASQPTPWMGLWERINISVFLLWAAVVAVSAEREARGAVRREPLGILPTRAA